MAVVLAVAIVVGVVVAVVFFVVFVVVVVALCVNDVGVLMRLAPLRFVCWFFRCSFSGFDISGMFVLCHQGK